MGNYYCKKCGIIVCTEIYYTNRTIGRHSCRIANEIDLHDPYYKGWNNCRHQFIYKFWCNPCC